MYKLSLSELRIVLIADRTFQSNNQSEITGNQLEMISNEYFEDIYTALLSICKEVVHYQSPEELINNAHYHKDDLVFTIFGGSDSRNRMALVPAICESYNIKFVGADVYARIVCQDKYLAKQFAKRFNVPSPNGILIENASMLTDIKELNLPLVIKPNFEGSSIGIDENSKTNSYEQAVVLVVKLLNELRQPVLVEEFIPGKEVVICIIGNNRKIKLFDMMEIIFENDVDYFIDKIFSAKDKHLPANQSVHKKITEQLTPMEVDQIEQLYHGLGKIDFMRIDGRINEHGFTMIELTPDGYIGSDSSFNDAARLKRISYPELLSEIIHTALENYHTPYSNYKENS